ncbi:hypothetical protein LI328DRAFT_96225 [Trichoderma asperelloides]|nr:hypothetical protein LI328DRAFT_96225 [Trichoderma asperelloides]
MSTAWSWAFVGCLQQLLLADGFLDAREIHLWALITKDPFPTLPLRKKPMSQHTACIIESDNRTLVVDKASVCRRFWAAALLLSEVDLPHGDGRISDSF